MRHVVNQDHALEAFIAKEAVFVTIMLVHRLLTVFHGNVAAKLGESLYHLFDGDFARVVDIKLVKQALKFCLVVKQIGINRCCDKLGVVDNIVLLIVHLLEDLFYLFVG